jgi:hypothetical protein
MTAIEALEAFKQLREIRGDPEMHHIRADQILVDFLMDHDPACADIARAYRAAEESAEGWWYA